MNECAAERGVVGTARDLGDGYEVIESTNCRPLAPSALKSRFNHRVDGDKGTVILHSSHGYSTPIRIHIRRAETRESDSTRQKTPASRRLTTHRSPTTSTWRACAGAAQKINMCGVPTVAPAFMRSCAACIACARGKRARPWRGRVSAEPRPRRIRSASAECRLSAVSVWSLSTCTPCYGLGGRVRPWR